MNVTKHNFYNKKYLIAWILRLIKPTLKNGSGLEMAQELIDYARLRTTL